MKNLLKSGVLALVIAVSLTSCGDGDRAHGIVDTTKTDSLKKDAPMKTDTAKAGTAKKDTAKKA